MGCKTKPIILIIIKDWGKTHSVDTHLFDKMSPDKEELLPNQVQSQCSLLIQNLNIVN